MKLLLDMNVPPRWVAFLSGHGHDAFHWSDVGPANAPDEALLKWARANDCIVFSHDLDFSNLLALTHGAGPSVVQVRTQMVFPENIGSLVISALETHQKALQAGAILTIEPTKSRIRLLPLN